MSQRSSERSPRASEAVGAAQHVEERARKRRRQMAQRAGTQLAECFVQEGRSPISTSSDTEEALGESLERRWRKRQLRGVRRKDKEKEEEKFERLR